MNVWLAANEPKLTFQFPAPDLTRQNRDGVEPKSKRGINKQDAIRAFGDLIHTDLGSALEDGPKWIVDARLSKGSRGGKHQAIWCPVLLAVCLRTKGVPKPKLNKVFHENDFLNEWRDQWTETARDLP